MAKKVFLGVGHGGSDPGACGNGLEEEDINLAMSLACRDVLVRHGVEVKMSRTKDENDTLGEEIQECNAYNPDLAVDMHTNAGGGDGAEAFCHIGGGLSRTLAQNIMDEVVKIGQNSRGVKTRVLDNGRDYYGFIRETKAPAVIFESAFIDNAKDIQIVDTAAEQKKIGEAVAKGILKTLGITYKAAASTSTSTVKLDNTPDAYAKEDVAWAKKEGILLGDDKGNLMLHENITRQDFIVMLHRALKK